MKRQKIGTEYVVANALVELYENLHTRTISVKALREYGTKVKEVLRKNNEIDAVILLSDFDLQNFAHGYSNLFDVTYDTISMKENTTPEMIRKQIIAYMRMDILISMLDEQALEVLGITM